MQGVPAAVNDDVLAIVRARRERGESVTEIAKHLGIGPFPLYWALDLGHNNPRLADGKRHYPNKVTWHLARSPVPMQVHPRNVQDNH